MTTSAATSPAPTVSRLHCHASAQDPKVLRSNPDAKCAMLLGYATTPVRFSGVAAELPAHPDGRHWVRCSRCKTWNIFEAVTP